MKLRMTLAAGLLSTAVATAAFAQQQQPDAPAAPPQRGAHGQGFQGPPPQQGPRGMRAGFEGRPGFDGHGEMRHRGGHEFGWWKNPEVAKAIGLTPDQTKKLDDLSLQGELNLIKLRAAAQENEVLLHATLSGPTIDEGKADAQIDKMAESRAAIEKAQAHLAVSLRSVLTPEQWTKLHEHHGMRRGPQGPQDGPAGPKDVKFRDRRRQPPAPTQN